MILIIFKLFLIVYSAILIFDLILMDQPVDRSRPLHSAAPFHFQVSRRLPPPPLHWRSHDVWQALLLSVSGTSLHFIGHLFCIWQLRLAEKLGQNCQILSTVNDVGIFPIFKYLTTQRLRRHLFSTALFTAVVASNPMNRVFNCGFPMDSASHDGRTIRAPPPPPPWAPSSPPGWTRFARSRRRRKGERSNFASYLNGLDRACKWGEVW